MFDLEQVIRERHSTRLFLSQPVPRASVEEALALAVCAPSNSNIQPWHVVFAPGPARDRLVHALLEEAQRRPPNIPPLPESFQHYRRELGAQVYGAMGIAREDKATRIPCRRSTGSTTSGPGSGSHWPSSSLAADGEQRQTL